MASPSERYWELVNSLINRGVTTKEAWFSADPSEFLYYQRLNKRGFRVGAILRDVVRHMAWSKTLYDYATGCKGRGDPRDNTVHRLLRLNGYDPHVVGTVMVKWSALLTPRNTLWVSGDPRTGASALVEALVYLSPLRSSADWRNTTNPFEGCLPSLVLWWDGGRVSDRSVELCLRVFRGEHVRFDREAGSRGLTGCPEMFRTPVVIYSDNDMTSTVTRSGRETSCEYTQLLRQSMYRLHLTEEMPRDISHITCRDMKEFLTWANDNRVQVEDKHELR
ncbi:ORF14A [Aviadenovirus phalacrocoracidae]|uniref:ORF14A n=1 Tax=Aviadenovirus sp. TaxID=2217649 RepID=A0ABZ0T2C6_9ADEN|nr:ORF14A [Aviadenovirus sp.]